MAKGLPKLLNGLTWLVILIAAGLSSLAAADATLDDRHNNFLAELENLQQSSSPQPQLKFSDYASGLENHNPEQLLKIVDERISIRPYIGSMVDPAAALMGGVANSLDRARLLSALLDNAGYRSRVVFVTGQGSIAFPDQTPAPVQPLDPKRLQYMDTQVQLMSAGIWERICTDLAGCMDWMTSLNDKPSGQTIYWVQSYQNNRWNDLVPFDTQLTNKARAQAETLSDESLTRQRWIIGLQVSTSYSGISQPTVNLSVDLPAATLHGKPITYYNIPNAQLTGYIPTLAVAGLNVEKGQEFPLVKQGASVSHQQLHIKVKGPTETRQYVRKLATPMEGSNGLELAIRGKITVATGPYWEEVVDELVWGNLFRLANLLYAEPTDKDPLPLNFASIKAISFLVLSRRLSGQVGSSTQQLLGYQGRPAVIFQREYPERSNGEVQLFSDFDIVDPGHAISCEACLPEETLKAAVEQSVVDGALEDWIAGSAQAQSSHWLVRDLLGPRTPLSKNRQQSALWSDLYTSGGAVYRLGNLGDQAAGWRLDPGPQVVPILVDGQGGVRGEVVAASATSAVLRNIYKHVTSKCGASDIGGSILLAMAGAPMTAPLLSGIVGHMCRVAEAYNKAASVLNCLEFMGNDCSAQDAAKELENILKGLGNALATDLAIAQAFDIGVGAAIHGVISPALKTVFKNWGKGAGREAAEGAVEGAGREATESATEGAGREAAEAATESVGRETAEAATESVGRETAEAATEGAGRETVEGATEGAGRETGEGATKGARDEPTIKEPEEFDPTAPDSDLGEVIPDKTSTGKPKDGPDQTGTKKAGEETADDFLEKFKRENSVTDDPIVEIRDGPVSVGSGSKPATPAKRTRLPVEYDQNGRPLIQEATQDGGTRTVRGIRVGDNVDVGVTLRNPGGKPVKPVITQKGVYADDVNYLMWKMANEGSNYKWTDAGNPIIVDPVTGVIQSGHHRLYAAGQMGREVPADAITWRTSAGRVTNNSPRIIKGSQYGGNPDPY